MINVEMLSTGDEVLHGQIVDTNAAWLADFFFNQGLPLTRRNTVGDDLIPWSRCYANAVNRRMC
jgi:molybdopterin-biosynthesis enzyme MoeA-like protein